MRRLFLIYLMAFAIAFPAAFILAIQAGCGRAEQDNNAATEERFDAELYAGTYVYEEGTFSYMIELKADGTYKDFTFIDGEPAGSIEGRWRLSDEGKIYYIGSDLPEMQPTEGGDLVDDAGMVFEKQ